MRTTSIGVAFTILVLGASGATAQESRLGFELRGGAVTVTEDPAGADLGTGASVAFTLSYRLQPHLGLYGGWGWRRFPSEESFAGAGVDFEQTGYVAGLRFEHPFRGEEPGAGLAYRLHAGGTWEHFELEDGDDRLADSGHGLGWEAGAALVVPIAKSWQLVPGVSYRSLDRDVTVGTTTSPVRLRAVVFDIGVMRGR